MAQGKQGTSVSKKKFMDELKKRHLTMSGVSKECGFQESYLAVQLSDANKRMSDDMRIHPAMVRLLYEVYNIRPESILYEVEKPKQENPKKAESVCSISPDTLYQVIYSAVYEAMKRALQGD